MTAIIAVLDNKWVHIWTDSREWADWRKSDNKVKCITISDKIIYACAWESFIVGVIERFYNNNIVSIDDDTLLKLREYIEKYTESDFCIIISDWVIIKILDSRQLRDEHTHTWCWSWWLQAMSVYLFVKWIEFWDDEETFIKYWINQAIKMDINCWWEAKYYFLKKPEAKEEKKSKRTMASDLAKLRKTDGQ